MEFLAAVARDVQLAAGYPAVWLDEVMEVPRSVSGARDLREWSRHVVRRTPATLIVLYAVAVLLDAPKDRYRSLAWRRSHSRRERRGKASQASLRSAPGTPKCSRRYVNPMLTFPFTVF